MPDKEKFNLGNIIGGMFSGIWSGGSGKFSALSQALAVGGGIAKSFDGDDKGIDDAAGDFAIAASKIFGGLDSGEKGKALKAVAAARIALDAVEVVIKNNVPVVNN